MSAKDIYHDTVIRALQKDGWSVTHQNFSVTIGGRDMFVDIGAERLLAAERGDERIAVEVKSFVKPSPMQDLKEAVGQFQLYEYGLSLTPPHTDRVLYLALRQDSYTEVFGDAAMQEFARLKQLRFLLFDPSDEEIKRWIK